MLPRLLSLLPLDGPAKEEVQVHVFSGIDQLTNVESTESTDTISWQLNATIQYYTSIFKKKQAAAAGEQSHKKSDVNAASPRPLGFKEDDDGASQLLSVHGLQL